MKSLLALCLAILPLFNVEGTTSKSISAFIEALKMEKTYLMPEQIVFAEGEIYYLSSSETSYKIDFIGKDQNGFYTLNPVNICHFCNRGNLGKGCINTDCPMYGK